MMHVVLVPPGPLDFSVVEWEGRIVVMKVPKSSKLRGLISPGDRFLRINNVDVSYCTKDTFLLLFDAIEEDSRKLTLE